MIELCELPPDKSGVSLLLMTDRIQPSYFFPYCRSHALLLSLSLLYTCYSRLDFFRLKNLHEPGNALQRMFTACSHA